MAHRRPLVLRCLHQRSGLGCGGPRARQLALGIAALGDDGVPRARSRARLAGGCLGIAASRVAGLLLGKQKEQSCQTLSMGQGYGS